MKFNAAKKKYARLYRGYSLVCEHKTKLIISTLSYLNRPEENWVDERRHAHTDRPAGDAEPIALCTHLAWKDLGWQQESDGAPGGRIDQIEHEQHSHCRRRER
jgi:hypothetical protein